MRVRPSIFSGVVCAESASSAWSRDEVEDLCVCLCTRGDSELVAEGLSGGVGDSSRIELTREGPELEVEAGSPGDVRF